MLQDKIFESSVKIKRDRYKPLFCSTEFYQVHESTFCKAKTFLDTTVHGNVAPLERFIVFTLLLSLLRRQHDWFGGFEAASSDSQSIPNDNPSTSSILNYVTLNDFRLMFDLKIPNKVAADLPLLKVIQQIRIKSIPRAALWGLHFASQNPSLFEVTKEIPSPLDLLKIQTRGRRVFTFDDSIEAIQQWSEFSISGRDPLSFWLHDLVHCWEYFAFPEKMRAQQHFYQLMDLLIEQNTIPRTAFHGRDLTSEKLNYVISDMNSHPLHLLKTLRAILDAEDSQSWLKVCDFIESITGAPSALLCINNKQEEVSRYGALLHELSQINSVWLKAYNL